MSVFKNMVLSLIIIGLAGCGANKQSAVKSSQIENLKALVEEGSYVINVISARPLATGTISRVANSGLLPPGSNVGRIDLTGLSSYLRVNKDSVAADLPYYGERQISAPYNTNRTGIEFDGTPNDFEVEPNAKTSGYTVRFNINGKNGQESLDVIAQLLPDLSSTISINSSHRTAIWYSGRLAKNDTE